MSNARHARRPTRPCTCFDFKNASKCKLPQAKAHSLPFRHSWVHEWPVCNGMADFPSHFPSVSCELFTGDSQCGVFGGANFCITHMHIHMQTSGLNARMEGGFGERLGTATFQRIFDNCNCHCQCHNHTNSNPNCQHHCYNHHHGNCIYTYDCRHTKCVLDCDNSTVTTTTTRSTTVTASATAATTTRTTTTTGTIAATTTTTTTRPIATTTTSTTAPTTTTVRCASSGTLNYGVEEMSFSFTVAWGLCAHAGCQK